VCGEIKMRTIHESNHAVMKLMETIRRTILTKKIQFVEVIKHY